jgi:hypothetical protein
MGKLRPHVRHPALPGTPRAKAGLATLAGARDARERARLAQQRVVRRKTVVRKQGQP